MTGFRSIRRFGAAVFLIAACTQVAAETWDIKRLIQLSLETHPAIAGKRSSRAAAEADLDGAEWARFPALTIEANAEEKDKTEHIVRVDQPVWAGGRISAGIDAARSRVNAAQAATDETTQELLLRVVSAAGEALRQRDRQQIQEFNAQEHTRLLDMIRRRVQQEVSPQADELLAESRAMAVLNELSAARQARTSALTQLSQFVGQPVDDVVPSGFDNRTVDFSDLTSATQAALDHSPTLKRLAFEVEAADADAHVKRAALSPQLLIRFENRYQRDERLTRDKRAMLVFQAQPGAGLSAASGVDAAVARREAIRLNREEAERTLRERISIDWNEWAGARDRLGNAERVRSASAEVAESYARQYIAGRKSWLDVLNAVRESAQADLARVDARYQMLSAAWRLGIHTGRWE